MEYEEDRPRSRSRSEYEEDRPRSRSRSEYEEDRPRSRNRSEYEEDRPRSRSRSEYEEDRPRSRSRSEYEEDRPRSRSRSEYEEDRPRSRSRSEYEEDRPRSRGRSDYGESYTGGSGNGGSRKAPARKKQAKKKKRIIMFTVEILALVVLGVVLWGVMKQTSVQHITVNEEEIAQNFNDTVEENQAMKGYRNIALFGLDARDDNLGKGNRSDTIMIASINMDTGDVKLVSVYRDTYMNLGNDRYSKCNAAYAAGGPQQAIMMLNMNLDMNITDYVCVGFNGLIDAVDALGGVEIDIQEAEIEHLNNYQASMFSTEDHPKLTDDYVRVTHAGRQTLNGLQATAYCRIRATAGSDFRRAERQRTVLMACFEKAKTASIGSLNDAMNKLLGGYVATSLDTAEMLEILQNVTSYRIVETEGFPFEDSRATGRVGQAGSCVIPLSLESNVAKLHQFLFPQEEEYTPSDAVKSYSSRVASDTAGCY